MAVETDIRLIRDIMRKDEGVDGDAQRLSQMVWMLFLKIFADKEVEWSSRLKNYNSPIPNKYKWKNWAAKEDGMTGDELIDFINNGLFPALKNIDSSQNDQAQIVKSVFEDTYNYMKKGTLFRQVINVINKIDFKTTEDRHLFNEIYESLLKELQSAGSSGEYYTPRAVTQFMVEMVNPKKGETVLDPACGTGGFLVCAIEHVQKQVNTKTLIPKLQGSIRGVEKKPLPHLLCTTNLILHGFDQPAIIRGNMLSKPYDSWTPKSQVNIILTNPPFGGAEEDGTEKNFPKEFRTKETADLFLILIIKMLKKNGRASIVLPDSILFGNTVKTRIKEELLTQCNLHTIIRLPNGVFNPYTSIKTNLLFFDKGQSTKEIWYYEMPYPDGVKSFNKSRTILMKDFDNIRQWWNNRSESAFSWKVNFEEIQQKNFNLDFKKPIDPEESLQTLSSKQILEKLLKNLDHSKNLVNQIQNGFK